MGPTTAPPRQFLIAMQPGTCGATVIDNTDPKAQPSTIILPPPITARGTLTLGGKPPKDQIGVFRILAQYRGDKNLNSLLDVSTTPHADGTFELSGLTPGEYLVQASLDGIWLSDSVKIVAGEKAMPAVHLNIGEPGGPAMVHVASAKGKPLCGVSVIVDRPAGPLRELDWPAEFTSDGAGDVWIPALEAGKHTVRLKDHSASANFVVPVLPVNDAVAVKLVGP
jgi:hypothetical protein